MTDPVETILLRLTPACLFYERVPTSGGLYRYEPRWTAGVAPRDGYTPFLTPPSIGDTVLLWVPETAERRIYRVVDRDWGYATHGSPVWPYREWAPLKGPRLTIIVELAEGPFRDEAPVDDGS